ncbi:23S rRNA pseudouridine2605 synthase [Saccharopolyspora antimicrobica]|uniref:Pseudouridine synthase n=1 Tax=Saccharopolyspora antimicrobica TaxID=455193 RepID=A0A1I5H516_9PSEU|nr:pseudouridine synthase [Saccharopolyspora antimicrobica]RKT90138.1 23S rRNA pseudouridine2605 synthase [Saccharopolyspora antimicrobica]SFO43190.1 23S rRNA pseudouridine2605 synthase [Saccharopolyspora antimicrobica]
MTSENRPSNAAAEGVRLQKVLSQAGVASRRAAEEMIVEGRIEVDGEVVMELGRRVDPATAVIHVDGDRVMVNDNLTHLLLNKPSGILCTMSDDKGRPCIGDYLRERQGKLFHVGRLDQDTEGLLLITNDGELANRLMHPSYKVRKTYLAEVIGPIPKDLGQKLREGVELEDGPVKVDRFKLVDTNQNRALVEVVLHEGRKRIVRRLLKHVGHPVQRLVRTRIGDVRLTTERPGAIRPLNRQEVGSLYRIVGM